MKFFESHAHYEDAAFDKDRWEALARLPEQGIEYLLNCCSDLSVVPTVLEILDRCPFAYGSVGVHPHWTSETGPDYINRLRVAAAHPKVVAIGEIGLDYYWPDDRRVQKRMFCAQMELAGELSLPVIIHDRDAHEDTLRILEEYKLPGVLHRYGGPPELLERALELGMYVSYNCDLTYEQWNSMPKACLALTPWDRILLETDCPYAPPASTPQARCESGMVAVVAQEIAALRGVTPDRVAEMSMENAKRLFHIA